MLIDFQKMIWKRNCSSPSAQKTIKKRLYNKSSRFSLFFRGISRKSSEYLYLNNIVGLRTRNVMWNRFPIEKSCWWIRTLNLRSGEELRANRGFWEVINKTFSLNLCSLPDARFFRNCSQLLAFPYSKRLRSFSSTLIHPFTHFHKNYRMRPMKHYFTLISCTVRPKTVLGVTFHWPQEALRTFPNFVILISNHDLDKSAVKI